jgi:predicted DNA-binding ArsR family transcriptional regulator
MEKTTMTVRETPRTEMEQLQILIDSKSLPANIKTIEQAFTIAQFGKDLGLKPMQAFHQIYSIQGRLSLSAKALGGLLWANGIGYKTIQDFEKVIKQDKDGKDITDFVTTIEFYRNGITDRASFSWSEAVRAGWTTKENWTKMPE